MTKYILILTLINILSYHIKSQSLFITSQNCSDRTQWSALTDIYNDMNGKYWITNTNWSNPSVSYCEYYGITCDVDCNVIEIQLIQNNMTGAFPKSTNQLEYLQTISCDKNKITNIDTVGECRYLTSISFYNNNISSTIPDNLGLLKNLHSIELGRNYLTSTIPATFQNLAELTAISLYWNNLSGSIGNLPLHQPTLSFIRLTGNEFSGTIPDLSALTGLYQVLLSKNNFSGDLPILPQISHDKYPILELDVSWNWLTGTIPIQWSNTRITNVDLSHNILTGDIAPITRFYPLASHITTLDISNNNFATIFPNIDSAYLLQRFNASNNDFSDAIVGTGIATLIDATGNTRMHQSLYPVLHQIPDLMTYHNSTFCPTIRIGNTIVFTDGSYYDYIGCIKY